MEAANSGPLTAGALLDRPLAQLCEKSRLLDLIRNFIIFDNGIKKVPCPHQIAGAPATRSLTPFAAGLGEVDLLGWRRKRRVVAA
jgi:hypothetical protein